MGARAHKAIRAIILGRVGLNAVDRGTVLVVESDVGRSRWDLDGVETSNKSGDGGGRNGLVHRKRAMGEHGTFVLRCSVVDMMLLADVVDRGRR